LAGIPNTQGYFNQRNGIMVANSQPKIRRNMVDTNQNNVPVLIKKHRGVLCFAPNLQENWRVFMSYAPNSGKPRENIGFAPNSGKHRVAHLQNMKSFNFS